MGHYYNPSPPHIGAQQPLTPRKLTPPQSGPAAQSPPFNGGAKLAQGILTCWAVAAATAFTYGPLTTQKVTPPVTGPSVVKTPYQRLDYQIWRAWDAPDLIAWPNFVANRLTPPSAVNPILFLNAGEIDEAILASWAAPAPVVIYPNFVADSFPPISGPTPQNPPVRGSRVPAEVQVAWIPPPFVPVVAVNLDPTPGGPTPQNPPVRGSRVPAEVQVAWIPPVLLPVLAVNLDPTPAGPTPQNPPFAGTRVPVEVQVSWLPPVLLPVLAVNLDPPIDGTVSYTPVGSRVPVEVQVSWSPQVPAPVQRSSVLTPSVPQNPPFAGTRVPVEVQVSWLPPAPGPVLQVLAIPPSSVVPPYQPVGALVPTAVLVSWIPAPTPPLNVAVNLDPPISGPVPQNPPVRGSVVPTEVQVAWLLPVLAPVLPSKGIPASGPVVVYVPVGAYVPAAVTLSWQPLQVQPQVQRAFYTPSGPDLPQFPGGVVPAATQSWWSPGWALPQRGALFPAQSTSFPFLGARVPVEVLRTWDAPGSPVQPRTMRTTSGPAPSLPPVGGGAVLRKEVLVSWIPGPPMPIESMPAGLMGSFSYKFVASWRVAIVAPKNKRAVVPQKVKVAVVLPKSKTDTPPRGT